MIDYIASAHLSLSDEGLISTEVDDQTVWIGEVESDPRWPARLGPEPTWYLTELAELVDAWEDARRFAEGCRDAARAAYLGAIGGVR